MKIIKIKIFKIKITRKMKNTKKIIIYKIQKKT